MAKHGINIHVKNPPAGKSKGTAIHKKQMQTVKRGLPVENRKFSRSSKSKTAAMGGNGVPVAKTRKGGKSGQTVGRIV